MKEKNYLNDEPVWQVQGSKSFCKLKSDWLAFDKFHLSFVKHEGKPNCKQVAAIEGAVKVHGADGVLCLAEIVLSGAAERMAKESREKANGGYAQPFFASMGGTLPSRSKDGKCTFRQFSVSPGSKSDYVFTMMQCAGEVNSSTGGIQPVKGAQRETIIVPLSSGDIVDFSRSIINEHTAYRTMCMLQGKGVFTEGNTGKTTETASSGKENQNSISTAEDASRFIKNKTVCVLYDATSVPVLNNGVPLVVSLDKAVDYIKDVVKLFLAAPETYVCDTNSYKLAVEAISEKKIGYSTLLSFTGKRDPSKRGGVIIVIDDII